METSINAIKQPKPSTIPKEEQKKAVKPKRQFNRPNVGVVDVPKISNTPISDTMSKNKAQNPYITYKLDKNTNKKTKRNIDFNNFVSIAITALGIGSLASLIKSFKK